MGRIDVSSVIQEVSDMVTAEASPATSSPPPAPPREEARRSLTRRIEETALEDACDGCNDARRAAAENPDDRAWAMDDSGLGYKMGTDATSILAVMFNRHVGRLPLALFLSPMAVAFELTKDTHRRSLAIMLTYGRLRAKNCARKEGS